MKSVSYAPEFGSLMYAMVATQLDIAHVVAVVSRFMHNPGQSHWNAIKHMFRYLAGTKEHGILVGCVATVVYSDNEGVVPLSKNPVHYNASKHIDVRYHFVQDCVISGKINLEKISTTDNVAEGMTKCLSTDRFRSLRQQMGVITNRSG